jgi:hypothetical protein
LHTEQGTYGHELATKADLAASTSTSLIPAFSGIAIQGSTVTGDYTSTFVRDNTYWEIAEDAVNGMTIEFTFYIPEGNKPGVFSLFGRYTGQPAVNHHQELWIYNYESTSWELLNDDFIPGGNTSDAAYSHEYYERHIDRSNNNEVKIRTIHHVTSYNAAHRYYIDYTDVSSIEVITAADIADAVWSTAVVNYATPSTFGEAVRKTLGLSKNNLRIINQVYDGSGRLTSSTLRIFENATDLQNNTNHIAEYLMTATYDVYGKNINYQVIEN